MHGRPFAVPSDVMRWRTECQLNISHFWNYWRFTTFSVRICPWSYTICWCKHSSFLSRWKGEKQLMELLVELTSSVWIRWGFFGIGIDRDFFIDDSIFKVLWVKFFQGSVPANSHVESQTIYKSNLSDRKQVHFILPWTPNRRGQLAELQIINR